MRSTNTTLPKGRERYGDDGNTSSGMEAHNQSCAAAKFASAYLLKMLERQFDIFAQRHGISFADARLLCMNSAGR